MYSQALAKFTEALRMKPNGPTTLFFRARCYENLGLLQDALQDYMASAAILPKADVYVNIGLIHKFRGAHKEATKAFSKACLTDPTNQSAKAFFEHSRSHIESRE